MLLNQPTNLAEISSQNLNFNHFNEYNSVSIEFFFPQDFFIHKTIISKKLVSSVAITIDFTHQPARVRSGQRSAPGCLDNGNAICPEIGGSSNGKPNQVNGIRMRTR